MQPLKKLKTVALTLLITGAIDSIRNLPGAALFGSALIFYFVFAALIFLIPSALVSAELSASVSSGGIYQWTRKAYGERIGFLAVWLQWINNIIWFPTILSFIAGTFAYLINPGLANNKYYLVATILTVFWGLTVLNFKGVRLSSKFTSFCAIAGLILPISIIIILLIAWVTFGHPLQIHLTWASMLPNIHHSENWIALTAIMLSFCGMELATVHISDVENPGKTFPKALICSTLLILTTMILGSLAIAFVLPYDKINLVNGTIETFVYFLSAYHLNWMTPILVLLLIVGSLGGMISWIISPVKGISEAAEHGFLPEVFQKKNQHGVPQNLLLLQAVLVSLVCLAFLCFPSVNASYWLLTALSTELYMFMYVLMFLAAMRLRDMTEHEPCEFRVPGKKIGLYATCILGLLGCFVTLLVGFIPPTQFNVGGPIYYETLFTIGLISMIVPVFGFYRYQAKNKSLKPLGKTA